MPTTQAFLQAVLANCRSISSRAKSAL